mgnify:CR=1 FL=1
MKKLIQKAIEESENFEGNAGIGNRVVFSLISDDNLCKIIVTDYTKLKLGLGLKPISSEMKNNELKKVIKKRKLNENLLLITNEEVKFPVINIDLNDLQKCNINYMIVDNEDKKKMIGRSLIPWLFDNLNDELILWQDQIKINREEVIAEINLCKNRSLVVLKNNKNYIILR